MLWLMHYYRHFNVIKYIQISFWKLLNVDKSKSSSLAKIMLNNQCLYGINDNVGQKKLVIVAVYFICWSLNDLEISVDSWCSLHGI